jgi:tetratricopeptide (TPR) repeat protein
MAQSAPPPAEAPSETEERAKLLFGNGRALYSEGNYEAAILAFQEAYALSNRHSLLFNIANAEERLGRLDDALDTLNRFRVYADQEQQEAINRRIYNIERRLRETPPSSEVPAAGASTAPAATAPVSVPAPVASAPVASAPRPGLWTMGAGLVVAAGSGAAAIFTYDASRPLLEAGGPDDRARYERLRPVNNASVAGAMLGGAVAVTGLVVDLARRQRPRPGVALVPTVAPARTGAVPALVVAWEE